MKTRRFFSSVRLVLLLALLSLTGCATIQYRTVQSQFEQAVRADNEQATQPFTDTTTQYAAVAGDLTPAYIGKLDDTLQPNAWTLRAVSEWRSGKFDSAIESANQGLATIEQLTTKDPKFTASRDSVILTMIPGLVEDSRLRQRFKEFGPDDVATNSETYSKKFRNALNAMVEAKEKMSAPTPVSVRYYWYYQCWRVLENWQLVISKLPAEPRRQANREADKFIADGGAEMTALGAENMLGAVTLPNAIANARAGIPPDHAYSKLIGLESQR